MTHPFWLALALPLAACGPVGSTSVIGDAEVAVARAHASDGDKYAVYETTSADLYLQKAKEEQGHAHYDAASELAKKSEDFADAARQKAGQQRNSSAPPMPRANVTHEGPGTQAAAPQKVGTPTIGTPMIGTPTIVPSSNPPSPAPAIVPTAPAPAIVPAPAPVDPTNSTEGPRTPVLIPAGTP